MAGAIIACLCLAAIASASLPRYCGTIAYRFQGITYRDNVYVTAGTIACTGARDADYKSESRSSHPGWKCSSERMALWVVCQGAGSTVRGIPWAGGPALPKQPRSCGFSADYRLGGSTYYDEVNVLGGSVACAEALIADRTAETATPGPSPHIPGWECNWDSRRAWVTCDSPTSVFTGVVHTRHAPPPKITVAPDAYGGLQIALDPTVFCPAVGPPQPVVVSASYGSDVARTVVDAKGCDSVRPDPAHSSKNDFSISDSANNSVAIGDFSFQGSSDSVRHMTYDVTDGSRTLATGRFDVDYTPASRVTQGSDAFVNYCIDEGATIYSEGGVLVCYEPASYYVQLGWSSS